ncbi:hypothetical protein Q1695_014668 [Nippostrongylus brasiliensis]|nr:hypothetical protein Q1695_014668 [Nippostrongylus brasiliensis]
MTNGTNVGDFNATVGTNDCDEWRLFDVSVLPSFDNGLDHRLVRAKLTLNKKIFKVDTHKPAPFRITSLILQELEHAIESYDWECLEDSSEDYNLLVSGLLRKRSLPHWMQVSRDRAVWKSCGPR